MSTTTNSDDPLFRLKLQCDTMCAFVSSYGSPLGMPIADCFDAYRAAVMDASDRIQDLNSPLTISLVSDVDHGRKLFEAVFNPSDSPSSSLSCKSKLCLGIPRRLAKFFPAAVDSGGATDTLRDHLSDSINLSSIAARMSINGATFEIHGEGGAAARPPLVTISMGSRAFWDVCFAVCDDLRPSEMAYANRAYANKVVGFFRRFVAASSPPVRFKRQCPFCWKTSELEMPEALFRQWRQAGVTIQDVLPSATADEREMHMTGIHPECWDTLPTGDTDDDDDDGSDSDIDLSPVSFGESE